MNKAHTSLASLAISCLAVAAAGPAQAWDDGRGKDWRSVSETINSLSWEQIAAACALDGQSRCTGATGGLALKKWVWATAPQVKDLFGLVAPAILTSPTDSVAGFEYFAPAALLQGRVGVTAAFQGCPTYQACFNSRFTTGMTSTNDGYATPAQPFGGEINLDIESGTAGLRLFKPIHPSTARGLWMWRPTGLNGTKVYANDDSGTLPNPGGGVAVADVLANDWAAGARATLANVSLSALSSSIAGVWLDPATGAVQVAAGVAAGTYGVDYRICNLASLADCDDATVTVVVRSFPISASNDVGYASMAAGGTPIANVLANDRLGATTPTSATVRLTQVSSSNPGVSLNVSTGAVTVAAGTPHGTHTLAYRICEIANAANCASATATVNPYSIQAVNDYARISSNTGGIAIASVLNNDVFNGARATTSNVQISLPAPLPYGITLNTSNGAVSVAPKTSSGLYSFAYVICEIQSPANCSQATVSLDLSGKNN